MKTAVYLRKKIIINSTYRKIKSDIHTLNSDSLQDRLCTHENVEMVGLTQYLKRAPLRQKRTAIRRPTNTNLKTL